MYYYTNPEGPVGNTSDTPGLNWLSNLSSRASGLLGHTRLNTFQPCRTTRQESWAINSMSRASCPFDRGLIVHENGFGWLSNAKHAVSASRNHRGTNTYQRKPRLYSSPGTTSRPSGPTTRPMWNTASARAMVSQTESSAIYRPGQIRRPKPNAATEGSRTEGSSSKLPPSDVRMKRSGLKAAESG